VEGIYRRLLDDEQVDLIVYAKTATFQTVMGDIAFGSDGEWREPRVLQAQFQGIVGHDARQFKDGSRQAVVSPHTMTSGALIDP
jgi:branched-chain amino acid transport system substrate-binding protein